MTFTFPVGPAYGKCNICGKETNLTLNHVPPKAWAKGIALRVASIADAVSGEKRPRSYKIANGVCFRTLCKGCNGAVMAPYDKALTAMSEQVVNLLRDPGVVTYSGTVKVKPQLVARGVLGHICSVGLGRYDEKLSRHLFDPKSDLLNEVRLCYWVYPYAGRTVLRDFAMGNLGTGKSSAMYILKSYPMAFALVWNRDFSFDQWQPRNFDGFSNAAPEEEVDLALDFFGLPGQLWPEHVQGNHIAGMHSNGVFIATELARRKPAGRRG